MVPYVHPLFLMPIWQTIFPSVKKSNMKRDSLIQTARDRVALRLSKDADRKDILEKLIERHRDNPKNVTVEQLETEAVVALFAGQSRSLPSSPHPPSFPT